MKGAICFSGDLRDFSKTKDFWLKFVHHNNLDVYCSFWKDTLNLEDYEEFISTFNPVKYEIEPKVSIENDLEILRTEFIRPNLGVDGLRNEYYEKAESLRILSMWYRIWRCNLLTRESDYDILVRARTDIYFDEVFDLELNDFLNTTHTFVGIWNWENNWGPDDTFAYGNRKVMDYYSSLFLKFYSYFQDGELLEIAENMLRVHLSKKDLTIRQITNKLYLRDDLRTMGNQEIISFSSNWLRKPLEEYSFFSHSRKI